MKEIIFHKQGEGYLVSFGNENFLDIWWADPNSKKPFIGRLSGHIGLIQSVKSIY